MAICEFQPSTKQHTIMHDTIISIDNRQSFRNAMGRYGNLRLCYILLGFILKQDCRGMGNVFLQKMMHLGFLFLRALSTFTIIYAYNTQLQLACQPLTNNWIHVGIVWWLEQGSGINSSRNRLISCTISSWRKLEWNMTFTKITIFRRYRWIPCYFYFGRKQRQLSSSNKVIFHGGLE